MSAWTPEAHTGGAAGSESKDQRVVILNGPAGVGKTTTARLLASMVPNGACVHGDALREFIVSRQDGTVRQGLGFLNGASIVTNFVEAGYDLVVFDYVFEKSHGLDVFRSGYHGAAPVHLFTLWADLDRVIDRERSRPGRGRLGQRVTDCYRTMEQHLGSLGCVIDTSEISPRHVADAILDRCADGDAILVPPRDGRVMAAAGT
jgi:chloramphenicol 3-O-phosphotransferase